MSKKYKEGLDKIFVNDEMKKRILSNVQLVAACFTVAVCLSVAKNYPEFLKIQMQILT